MNRLDLNRGRDGFTIIELMIATAVFSIILLIVCAGVIAFTHEYLKGITANNTQTVARTITNRLVEDIQNSSASSMQITNPTPSHPQATFCIGSDVYSYTLGAQVEPNPDASYPADQDNHGLVEAPISCDTSVTPDRLAQTAGATELLGQGMRLGALSITQIGSSQLYTVEVTVIYGDADLLTTTPTASTDWGQEACKSGAGSQYCDVSQLTTQVDQRLQ